MRILLVEDDAIIGDGLMVGLSKQGMTIDWITDGEQAKHALDLQVHDIVILDLTLPKVDGLELLSYWRKQKYSLPIIILTARDSINQKVEGLNLGADDYLVKPFSIMELVARLRALQRRYQNNKQSSLKNLSHTLSHEFTHEHSPIFIRFNTQTRKLFRNDTEISISPKALRLLEIFLSNKNSILSKNTLEEKLYAWNDEVSSNTIEVHIHHLRSKLGSSFIKTIHGIGYTLGNKDSNFTIKT